MERNGRRAAGAAVMLRTLVPLTSREGEERCWYDTGDRGAGGLPWRGAGFVYRFDRFGCDDDGLDIAWSCVDVRSDH